MITPRGVLSPSGVYDHPTGVYDHSPGVYDHPTGVYDHPKGVHDHLLEFCFLYKDTYVVR